HLCFDLVEPCHVGTDSQVGLQQHEGRHKVSGAVPIHPLQPLLHATQVLEIEGTMRAHKTQEVGEAIRRGEEQLHGELVPQRRRDAGRRAGDPVVEPIAPEWLRPEDPFGGPSDLRQLLALDEAVPLDGGKDPVQLPVVERPEVAAELVELSLELIPMYAVLLSADDAQDGEREWISLHLCAWFRRAARSHHTLARELSSTRMCGSTTMAPPAGH